MSEYRLLITGSRDWDDERSIRNALLDLRDALDWTGRDGLSVVLVSGACPTGADMLCEKIAAEIGWTIERHPAKWKEYGKSAGPRRNAEMVNLGANLCFAFIKNESRGATHAATIATAAGIPVRKWLDRG